MQKTYPGEYIKTNNSGETDKPRGSLSRENRPETFKKSLLPIATKVLCVLHECKK